MAALEVEVDPHAWLKSRGFDARNLSRAVPSVRSPEVTSTPLYEACCEGNLAMCRFILASAGGAAGKSGDAVAATVSTPGSTGMTPFAAACGLGHLHVAKWLFYEAGAALDARTRTARGTTPLMVAAGYWGHLKVADW
jgi:ankyrin repeat protein